ncbi:hypothetical protein SanaruYs_37430 [Chryseotalea sanaruensis]|uniref:Uncharacterized protein n=1 Tax=Chryseotalea sanaruensis TaxID=2482724 RepID=A0A401UF17_9BACT|nr:hypothetical protein SanaruYs_37430 [Chryseotalea sanaruensis]
MTELDFYIKPLILTFVLIITGIGIKLYIQRSGIDNPKILGLNVFWLKFYSNAFLLIGIVLSIIIAITFYYQLKYEEFL